jgi:nucleotide-binding universal stress UspA family protein
MPGIVVGVDGSAHARRALAWAMHEAALRRLPLTAMTVQRKPVRPASEVYWPVPDYPEQSLNTEPARGAVRDLIGKVASETGETVPEITIKVAAGHPAAELVEAARDADLLVVGSHGRGGFSKLLVGSVSSQVLQHAACPVVIVRGPDQAA